MNSIDVSLPRSITVRGQEITKMPLGRYLQAIRLLESFPRQVAEALIPDTDVSAFLETLKTMDRAKLLDLALKALTVVPEQTVKLIAVLTEIPEETLLSDAAIGADGLLDIVNAWLEVNMAENFTQAARRLRSHISRLTATWKPGCSV